MTRINKLIVAALLATAMGLACFNDAGISPDRTDGKALVTGQVMANMCWFIYEGSPPPPFPTPGPYTEATGRQALVTFADDAGNIKTALTNDNSAYTLELDTGMYTMTVDTWHSWPRLAYDIHVTRDTTIDRTVWLEYIDPDTILCYFNYIEPTDTLGEAEERATIARLTAYTSGQIMAEHARRFVPDFVDPQPYETRVYFVPVRSGIRVWRVCDDCWRALDVMGYLFPDELTVGPTYIPCMFGGNQN